ncbi:MAG: hypothetical protein M0Q12_00070 [Synergistaceae bacterium]|nr:hypothetical protein [Synergistaceae bacterium]
MSLLFQRKIKLEVGKSGSFSDVVLKATNENSSFDISFDGEMTAEPEPNVMTISVFNLSLKTRTIIENAEMARLSFGYWDSEPSQIFVGDIVFARSEHVGVDWTTSITIADGGRAVKFGRINRTFNPGTTYQFYFSELCKSFNESSDVISKLTFWEKNASVFEKNMTSASNEIEDYQYYGKKKNKKKKPSPTIYANGLTINKKTRRALDDLCNNHSLLWFVHFNCLYVIPKNDNTIMTSQAVKHLDKKVGMLETPSKLEDGALTLKSLILPGIQPGGGIDVQSDIPDMIGQYRISKIRVRGSNFENDCYYEMETFAP